MVRSLLSIDWDYFIPIKKEWCGSYIENKNNLIKLWYKRYIKSKIRGYDIEKCIGTGKELNYFSERLRKHFNIMKDTEVYVSESHKLSYKIAQKKSCDVVFLFDAHSDLGYGGIDSLKYEVNCSNWLGKLLKDKIIKKAYIIYSPYTYENKKYFNEINRKLDINYCTIEELDKNINISSVHICRSGAWTPPWLDYKFKKFVKSMDMPYKKIDYFEREWNPQKLTLASQIDCMIS